MLRIGSSMFVTLLLSFCLLTVVHSQGGSIRLHFADSDVVVTETDSRVTTDARVEGDATGNLTVTIIPLTVGQYRADPDRYRNSCDRSIPANGNPAEASDFSGQEEVTEVPSDAIVQGQDYTFTVNIGLMDDEIREPDEYFLLFLNGSQSPAVDTITYPDSSRECIRVTIAADRDSFNINFVPLIEPIVVNEDAGTVEIIRVEKEGQTEEPVDVTFSGGVAASTISPSKLTLQPDETSAIISITVMDNEDAEGDIPFTITAGSQSGTETFGSGEFHITIRENDRYVVGFDQTEATVTEGETVTLSTQSFNKNITAILFGSFSVSTQPGMGNATEMHYASVSIDQYTVGEPIEISTNDSRKPERVRQFEVKLAYSDPVPFVVVHPDTVIVTIKDRDGAPNKPSIMNIGQEKDDLTVTWTIDTGDRRPVDTFVITVRKTGSRNQEDEDSKTVNVSTNCKLNGTKHHCTFVIERRDDNGKTYDVIVCAMNILGQNCSDPTPKPAPLTPDNRLPTGSVVGIVFGVIVAILACCLLWMLVALIVCCTCYEREKAYNPEKKEKENEKLRNQDRYTKVDRSESPTDEYDNIYV